MLPGAFGPAIAAWPLVIDAGMIAGVGAVALAVIGLTDRRELSPVRATRSSTRGAPVGRSPRSATASIDER